eukprot:9038726-Ditylum_brightwellii.AAC.1
MVKQRRHLNGDTKMFTGTNSLISYFESLDDYRYAVLYNDSIPSYEDVEDSNVIHHKRKMIYIGAVDAVANVKMVLRIAWTHKHLRKIAKSYGDVISVDGIEGTNEEERSLLTTSAINSLMKQ